LKRLFLLFLLLVVLAGGGAAWMHSRIVTPYRGFTADEVFVELPQGTGVAGIASRLVAAGVVPDEWTFRAAARWSGLERRLQAGEYRFAEPASPEMVVGRLARGGVYARSVTFPEGLTMFEAAAAYERSGLGTAADFTRAASDGALVANFDPEARTLEGYLFPDTYALPRSAGVDVLVRTMVERFDAAFDQTLRDEAAAQKLSAREVITLASLVEKETAKPEERPTVAAVYRNRLRIGMPMQADPTTIYALILARRWRGNLTRENLQFDSPYNTYRYPGLPPGPIASPGRASIEAAVRPADVPYLYFVSRNDGSHVFATTLDEHNRNVQRWQVRYFKDKGKET